MIDFQPLELKILELLSENGRPAHFEADQSLFFSGLLDSLSAIRLLVFIEETYQFNPPSDFNIRQIDSFNKIKALLTPSS